MPPRRPLPLFALGLVPLLAGSVAHANPPLDLAMAEAVALERDPLTARDRRAAEGLAERAVADAQLPDPKLKLGVLNLAADTLDRNQEPMTQVVVGAVQAFPPGDTLRHRGLETRALGQARSAAAAARQREVLRGLRRAWLDLHEKRAAVALVEESRSLFAQLVTMAERQYAAGRQNQQDILRAQLELGRLEDRVEALAQGAEVATADLVRWLGPEAARRAAVDSLPELSPVPDLETLHGALPQHPLVALERARMEAARQRVEQAREAYAGGWSLDVSYGIRDGDNPDGSGRSDFLSVMAMVDVPIFREKRQDRTLAARQHEAAAARLDRDHRLRELERELGAAHARWERLDRRLARYQDDLLAQARHTADASLHAYQSDRLEFAGLVRSQLTELETRLAALELAVERARTRVDLLYLAGETP